LQLSPVDQRSEVVAKVKRAGRRLHSAEKVGLVSHCSILKTELSRLNH
jgi:hypothetical protein